MANLDSGPRFLLLQQRGVRLADFKDPPHSDTVYFYVRESGVESGSGNAGVRRSASRQHHRQRPAAGQGGAGAVLEST